MGVILRQTAGSYFPKCAGSYFPFTAGRDAIVSNIFSMYAMLEKA